MRSFAVTVGLRRVCVVYCDQSRGGKKRDGHFIVVPYENALLIFFSLANRFERFCKGMCFSDGFSLGNWLNMNLYCASIVVNDVFVSNFKYLFCKFNII